jgi:exosome complex RNA-binding protein Rrp4
VVNGSNIISTYAGNGTQGYTGDGGAATSAELENPFSVAVDVNGVLYISDSGLGTSRTNSTIRKVASAGIISTFAGEAGGGGYFGTGNGTSATTNGLYGPHHIALDSSSNLFIADTQNEYIRKVVSGNIINVAGNLNQGFTGDGGPALSARLNLPFGVAVDKNGVVYIADTSNCRLRKVQ